MKIKHFTFDADYFPITNSNIFHHIKIQKNKNLNINKPTLKRFPLKNQLNLKEIPDIMFFEKSNKKKKVKPLQENISPISNQTRNSFNRSCDQIEWSIMRRVDQNLETERKVESCPKATSPVSNLLNQSLLKNSVKPVRINDLQKEVINNRIFNEVKYFKKESHKKSQLWSLEQCQSEFDQSMENSLVISKNQINFNLDKIPQIVKKSKTMKRAISEKHSKSKKTQKSHSCKHNSNPQTLSSKDNAKNKNFDPSFDKNCLKTANGLLPEESLKPQNKFISLNRKSYYLIGSKNNKNRSLNKEKKNKKNKPQRQDGNVILSNGDLSEHSSTNPSNGRNTSMTNSTVNSKIRGQNSKKSNNSAHKKQKMSSKSQLFQIVKKTGQILNKYQNQCLLLKKQKKEYQEKYQQAVKKLNRIKQEIEFVMKTQ